MRTSVFLPLVVCTVGCGATRVGHLAGDSSDDGGAADLAAIGQDGRAPAGPDLAYDGKLYRFVTDHVYFPQLAGDYGYASNGDGSKHNQFALLCGAMFKNNLPLPPAENNAISIDGDALALFSLGSHDPNLIDDPAAFVSVHVAKAMRQPDLTGAGTFAIDGSAPGGVLGGGLFAGTFVGADPTRTGGVDPTASFRVALVSTAPVTLPLVGARITFTTSASGLTKGQLNGAIRWSDMQKIFIPALAANLTRIEQDANGCGADCMNVKTLFDVLPKDGMVSPDEVTGSFLSNILQPDEQLFDAKGNWSPNPLNQAPDSFSFGVGFTAVKASFAE